MTVNMKVDLGGPKRRGLALGFNEAAGYLAVAAGAYLTGVIAERYGLRPEPFYIGIGFAAAGGVPAGVGPPPARDGLGERSPRPLADHRQRHADPGSGDLARWLRRFVRRVAGRRGGAWGGG